MNDAAQDVEPPVTPQPHHPNDTDRLHPAIPTYDFSEAETMETTHALTLPGIVARDLYRAQIPADVVRLAPVPDQLLTQQLAEIDAAKNAIPVTTPQVSTTSTPSKPPTTVPEPDTPPPTYNDATTATPPPPIRVPQPSQIEPVDIRMIARITYFAWNTRENLPQLDEYVEATTKHIETKLQAMPDFSDLEIAMIQVFRIMSRVTNNAMDEYRVIVGGLATRTQTREYAAKLKDPHNSVRARTRRFLSWWELIVQEISRLLQLPGVYYGGRAILNEAKRREESRFMLDQNTLERSAADRTAAETLPADAKLIRDFNDNIDIPLDNLSGALIYEFSWQLRQTRDLFNQRLIVVPRFADDHVMTLVESDGSEEDTDVDMTDDGQENQDNEI
ncbi:hypothetical protein E4T42_00656 [Aureobasidium subglaciale]|nr:hypothetical protein E4T42_00656 [Aureobasidium subglaciale]